MAILKPDVVSNLGGVTVNEYLLTKHNPNRIDMPTASMDGEIIGVTVHNTDWINTAARTTPAEQYTRATVNGNMNSVRVHYYVDNTCAWQNLPHSLSGWHAADGNGDGNRKTIAIECIMSSAYNDRDKKSEDNCAKLAAALLKKYGFGIDRLFTHTHWLNVRDGRTGSVDTLNTMRHPYKWCLPVDNTELLTPFGWKYLSEITTDDMVMAYNADSDSLSFENVTDVVEPYSATVIKLRDIEATEDHRMYAKPSGGTQFKVELWGDVINAPSREIKTCGLIESDGLPLTDDEIALLVWIQGDGHYMVDKKTDKVYGVEFHLKKERKIRRIKEILDSIGIEYSESVCKNGSVHIRMYGSSVYAFAETWLESKQFTYKLVDMNDSQFKTFISELLVVDGNNSRQMLYFSSDVENIDVVQAICATHGIKTCTTTLGTSKEWYGDRPVCVVMSRGSYNVGRQTKERESSRTAVVSCCTVDSGFILIRQNGHTFIVGNCPAYILPHWSAFKAKVAAYLNEGASQPQAHPEQPKKTNEEIAKEVIQGKWGNGDERKKKLTAAGYDYDKVQEIVRRLMNTTPAANVPMVRGTKVRLAGKLFASATATSGNTKTAAYYLYDGVLVNGRYRLTTTKANCGRTPIGSYVTGWANKSDLTVVG